MAEGLLRHFGGDRFEAFSAGTQPGAVHPLALRAMAEIGVDISGHRSKSVDQFLGQAFDFVITVCDQARESCPVFPGANQQLHWSLQDPSQAAGDTESRLEIFRRVRDQISAHVQQFILDHTPPTPAGSKRGP